MSIYLLGLGPLRLGEQLVLVAALDGAAETVDAVVGLLVGKTADGNLDSLGLLLKKIVVSRNKKKHVSHAVLSCLVVFISRRVPPCDSDFNRGSDCRIDPIRSKRAQLGQYSSECTMQVCFLVAVGCRLDSRAVARSSGRGKVGFVPEAKLAVAGGIGIPGSGGSEQLGQPRSAEDERSERGGHDGRLDGWLSLVVVVEEMPLGRGLRENEKGPRQQASGWSGWLAGRAGRVLSSHVREVGGRHVTQIVQCK